MKIVLTILIVVSLVVTIGLGILQYQLGKRQNSDQVGLITPIAYLIVRIVLAISVSAEALSYFGAICLAIIYWVIFYSAKKSADNQ